MERVGGMHGLTGPASRMQELRRWCQEIVAAAEQLYGRQGLAAEIHHACDKFLKDCERLCQQVAAPIRAVAVLGLAGTGKTWVARCFVSDLALRSQCLSRKEALFNGRLLWLGPQRPEWGQTCDHFRPVAPEQMLDLGVPYVVGDTPGWASASAAADDVCRTAIASASVKLVLIPQESLRDRRILQLFEELPGAVAVPIVRFRGVSGQELPDPETQADVEHYWQQWRRAAPNLQLHRPLFVPDADLFAPGEQERVVALVQKRLQAALRPLLTDDDRLLRSVEDEICGRRERLRQHLAGLLSEMYHRIDHLLQEIQSKTEAAVEALADKVIGSNTYLEKAIQWQLRAWCLEATPPWCFPYRSLLGLWILTSNAWDRLILALFGSMPSLLVGLWQGGTNLHKIWSLVRRQRINFAQQVQLDVQDRLADPLRRLRAAVARLCDRAKPELETTDQPILVRLKGLEEFQRRCRELVHEVVRPGAPRQIPRLLAYLATLLFAFLFGTPLFVIYRNYVAAAWAALQGQPLQWDQFPLPSFHMLASSFLLSAAPAAAVGMLTLVWSARQRRVRALCDTVRGRVRELVRTWRSQSLLRLEIDEPHLKAVKQLWTLKSPLDGLQLQESGGKAEDPAG